MPNRTFIGVKRLGGLGWHNHGLKQYLKYTENLVKTNSPCIGIYYGRCQEANRNYNISSTLSRNIILCSQIFLFVFQVLFLLVVGVPLIFSSCFMWYFIVLCNHLKFKFSFLPIIQSWFQFVCQSTLGYPKYWWIWIRKMISHFVTFGV